MFVESLLLDMILLRGGVHILKVFFEKHSKGHFCGIFVWFLNKGHTVGIIVMCLVPMRLLNSFLYHLLGLPRPFNQPLPPSQTF